MSQPSPYSDTTATPDLDIARAVGQLQGRCPGIPLDGGGYSGCEGGADCPVCLGGWSPAPDEAERDQARTLTALRAELERLGGPTCPNCHGPAGGPLWWSPRLAAHVCAQCALVHQGEGDQAERLAMLRGAVRRYLEARDAAQPEAEKVARDEIERML